MRNFRKSVTLSNTRKNPHPIYSLLQSQTQTIERKRNTEFPIPAAMTVLPPATTDAVDDDAQVAFAKRRCMSFCIHCFPSSWWQNLRSPANSKDRWWWWCRRWNAFVRRFRSNDYKKHCSFRYDPLSYALNFDDGIAAEEDGCGYKDFSARFASAPPPENKTK
ncbi:hypothetical protein JHK82_036547 [Glycine max]|nr:hypothetical protein JHK82_036547 [Glycine max]